MVEHVSIAVKDFDESCKYYDKTLSCLGYKRVWNKDTEEKQVAGYGKNGAPEFYIIAKKQLSEQDRHEQIGQASGFHVCFGASNTQAIQKWYETCRECGGKDNGKPGERFPGYYAAFIVDPNGWRTEACCHNHEA